MLKLMRAARWWIIGAIFILSVLAATSVRVSILPQEMAKQCEQHYEANKEYCPAYDAVFFFFEKIGSFLQSNNGAFSALAAMAVAVFTFTLWRSTHNLYAVTRTAADAAKATADATKMQMRAWVFAGPLLKSINSGAPGQVRFQVILGHYGQTPGRVTEYCVQTSRECPSGDPRYDDACVTRAEFPMGQGDGFPILQPFLVSDGAHVFGYVNYIDAFGKTHYSRFCGRVSGTEPKYVVAGGPRWNEFD